MHQTHAPRKDDGIIRVSIPDNRQPTAGKGRARTFKNWRKDTRTAGKVKFRREDY